MTKEEIREGDIVEIDYIEEFTGIHRKKGKALVLWKGLNNQPLITLLEGKYSPKWSCYEYISKVIGHISLEEALEQEPCEDAISRQAVIDGIKRYFHDKYYQRTSIQDCRDCLIEDVIKDLPSVTPKDDVLDKIKAEIADLDDADYDYEGYYKAVTDAVKIIDKYKADKEKEE